jgi:DNA-binding GntR family transcriptional regulator
VGALSLTEDVYEQLKAQIVRLELAPGAVVNEGELATGFGVSKTPVREALGLLARTGWIRVLPRRGYLVRPVELGDVLELFAIRRMVEPELARTAAETASPQAVADLGKLVEKESGMDFARALDAAKAFHLSVAEIAGNRRLYSILETLVEEVQRLHYLQPDQVLSPEELRAHRRIADAIGEGDGDAAAELMLDHLDEAARRLTNGFGGA